MALGSTTCGFTRRVRALGGVGDVVVQAAWEVGKKRGTGGPPMKTKWDEPQGGLRSERWKATWKFGDYLVDQISQRLAHLASG